MSETGIELLSQRIGPQTAGVLWLTDEALSYDSPGAYEINYLLDGIFVQSLAEKKTVDSSNFFLGESFGKPFFVGHTIIKDKADFKKVFKSLETAKPFIKNGCQIYILNKAKNTAHINVLKELKNKSPDVVFEHLNI